MPLHTTEKGKLVVYREGDQGIMSTISESLAPQHSQGGLVGDVKGSFATEVSDYGQTSMVQNLKKDLFHGASDI